MASTDNEPKGDISDPGNLNPEELGFMCGLEIHQQLNTDKLHSREQSILFDYTADNLPTNIPKVARKLRAAEGESGKVDIAAKFESRRNRKFVYVQSPNSGLIELDEQPPLPHDTEAVNAALTISGLMSASPLPIMQAMRKTVVDGSNTSGFQRTTLVSTNGSISTEEGEVGISLICLEEDSARKIKSELTPDGEIVTWNLDRLGIPLVEIATDPDIKSPEHAKSAALKLGTILRDTRMVRRGLGTIRQDLNVSIACGDRVEIKGCQDLDWIPKIIRLEIARQLHFYRLANKLRESRGFSLLSNDRRNESQDEEKKIEQAVENLMPLEVMDVSNCFSSTEAKLVENSLAKGGKVMATKLAGFSGYLGSKEFDLDGAQLPRLGRELSSAAKLVGVKGIFHSDELPAYGISEKEVNQISDKLKLESSDAFALCIGPEWQAQLALESVILRARAAYHRIKQEVRNVVIRKGEPEDGTTNAMRPLPGGARMYPETDIPPLILNHDYWQSILSSLPPSTPERLDNISNFDISKDQATQLVSQHLDDQFLQGCDGTIMCGHTRLSPKGWASLLLDSTRKEIAENIGIKTNEVPLLLLAALQYVREEGGLTREGIIPVAKDMLNSTIWPIESQINLETISDLINEITNRSTAMGYKPASSDELELVVKKVVADRIDFVKERGLGALGPLMGLVMKEFGGGADGKQVSSLLKSEIEDLTRK